MGRESSIEVAYAPWGTFTNALDKLHEKGLPEKLDRSVFAGQSGGTQAVLMASITAIGGIDSDRIVQPLLKKLVDPSTRKAALHDVIQSRYKAVLDLGPTATQSQFEQVFRDYGLSGATHRKAIGFFLRMADELGLKLSNHISRPTAISKPAGTSTSSGTNHKSRKAKLGKTGGGKPPTPPATYEQPGGVLFHPAVDTFLREARRLTEGDGWNKAARDMVIQGFTTQLDLFIPVRSGSKGRSRTESAQDDGAADS